MPVKPVQPNQMTQNLPEETIISFFGPEVSFLFIRQIYYFLCEFNKIW